MKDSDFSASALISKISTLLKQRFSVLLAALFILWTPILIGTTVKAQISCQPVVQWDQTLPTECGQSDGGPKPDDNGGNDDNGHTPDIIGALAGTAAVGVSTVVGAPAVAAAGVGVAVWFVVRTILGD